MTTSYDDNTTNHLADVPLPAGATQVYDWDDTSTDTPSRYWRGSSWLIDANDLRGAEDIEVFIDGVQHADGRVERFVHVHQTHSDDIITIEQVRQLAQALLAAADEAEQMNSYDRIEVNR
jgi:hypothetical protein